MPNSSDAETARARDDRRARLLERARADYLLLCRAAQGTHDRRIGELLKALCGELQVDDAKLQASAVLVAEAGRQYQQAEARIGALSSGLRELFALVENGTLVRDISHDAEPGWAVRQLPLVKTLATVKQLLAGDPEQPR